MANPTTQIGKELISKCRAENVSANSVARAKSILSEVHFDEYLEEFRFRSASFERSNAKSVIMRIGLRMELPEPFCASIGEDAQDCNQSHDSKTYFHFVKGAEGSFGVYAVGFVREGTHFHCNRML